MIPRRSLLAAALAALAGTPLAGTPLAGTALAGTALAEASPQAVVEGFHATLIEAMRNAQRLGVRGREARLRPVMESAFNLPAMARIAVGQPWTRLQPAEQQEITRAFSDWSIATFAHRFDGYSGERFETTGETTLPNGDRLVATRLVRPRDAPVQLNYLLRDFGGAWRIVDIYLTGTISELASRRAEFTTILRAGGAERLVAELRQRTDRLLGA